MTDLGDRDIRRIMQKNGYWYAASREDGPAHIVKGYSGRHNADSLCGANTDTTEYVRARDLCKRCRKKAMKMIGEGLT